VVAGLCAILPVLRVPHSSLRPSEISSEASLSSGNVIYLLGCPIHIKNSNSPYIPVGDPSAGTQPSVHHKYASHTCCIQAYSAAALGFPRFLSCGQFVRLEGMGVFFPLCSNTAFRLSFEEPIKSRHSCGSCLIPRAFIRTS
jgi:hypothetical protein